MVTRQQWWQTAQERLRQAGCEDAAFDALCLLEDRGGLPRGRRPDDTPLEESALTELNAALAKRADGYPLQYLLGEWDFLDLTLRVGEGVLIPRPDTEVLCEAVAARLGPSSRVLDLCAGSGCVGLGVASLRPDVTVTAVELSEQALVYLQENVARYPRLQVSPRRGDVLTDAADYPVGYEAVVSNPPYIPTGDLDGLMREVQHEPRMALDGAEDGLLFYRVIADEWTTRLVPGGVCAVEVGAGQAPDVAALFAAAGLVDVTVIPDYAGIDRVVLGVKK
ncbi:MAG: peptide chain release factor N(5)-glutamine methyltransferase [Ruminococcaceae bacterium]|nr:peptide chain release factor N(5)-glutamine methyltransferase [Oscillospiraceae bacterium]